MTTTNRTTALLGFGYNPHQAAFLALVASHGGYFLRRQYVTFLGRQDGAVVTDLLQRVVQRKHATRATYCRDTHVYHLSARPLYDALNLSNSRNRRPAQPAAVTFKLMTVDVVLRYREATFLATETEKVDYFTKDCRLSRAVLPATCYAASRPGRASTTRYFVDKAPIFVYPPLPDVTVVYLQGWSEVLAGFEAFVSQYRPLLTALAHARVIFATNHPHLAPAVPPLWDRLWRNHSGTLPAAALRAADLLTHFQARRRMEQRDWDWFEPRDLDRLRDDLQRFDTPAIQALYTRWCADGDGALDGLDTQECAPAVVLPQLTVEVLPFRYPLFPAAGGRA